MRHFTDDTFPAAIAEGVTLVLFYATWCGPCRAFSPKLEQLDDLYGSRVQIGKVDIDNNPRTTVEYGVKAIPTVLIFRDGQVVYSTKGGRPVEVLSAELDAVLGDSALSQ